ncbi:MAG TPA: WhiB family transcriptional regulator [Kineosporiaceae bacterium]|nr:WhiB family transcriptional regulator [Kineosporiaceae bacterium]
MGGSAVGEEYSPCVKYVVGQGRGDLWHPSSPREVPPMVATVCGTCGRRAACLSEGLNWGEEHGIWAGLPPVVLRRLRQRVLMSRDREGAVRDGLALADRIRQAPDSSWSREPLANLLAR